MKKYQVILLLCLSLVLTLPVVSTGETPAAAKAIPAAGLHEQEKSLDSSLLAAVPTGENSSVTMPAVAQQVQEVSSDNTPPNTGYNLQAYNSNEVASKAVERNIGFFSNNIRERFSMWLGRSGKYIEMMKEILRKKDVPENIVFLSLIESGFSPYAYSVANAAGPWQFIASTAKRYGLN